MFEKLLILLILLSLFYENINYLIALILIFQIIDISNIDKDDNLTIEDQYQRHRSDSIIYVIMEYEDENYFENILQNLEKRLIEYNENYNKYQNTNKICYSEKNYIYYCKYKFMDDDNYHYKFFIDRQKMKVHCYLNHEFIGGSYLLTLFYCFIDTPQKSSKILFPKSNICNLVYSLKLLYNYRNIPRVKDSFVPLVSQKSDIKRYKKCYDLSLDQKFSTKTVIIYNILETLYKALNLNRPLICYLPIAFQEHSNIKNNIGIMCISFDNDTLETFDKKIYNSRYHILATNTLLLYNKFNRSKGASLRKSIDIIISFMLAKEDKAEFKVSWTYENIGEYPVYVAVASVMKKDKIQVTQTITSNTSELDLSFDDSYKEISFSDYKL